MLQLQNQVIRKWQWSGEPNHHWRERAGKFAKENIDNLHLVLLGKQGAHKQAPGGRKRVF